MAQLTAAEADGTAGWRDPRDEWIVAKAIARSATPDVAKAAEAALTVAAVGAECESNAEQRIPALLEHRLVRRALRVTFHVMSWPARGSA